MTNEKTKEQADEWMRLWASDVRIFLLSDEDCMAQWVAFRQRQEQARTQGIDTTKPQSMIKVTQYVYLCQPDEDDERTRSH